jgi:hypothetical protein
VQHRTSVGAFCCEYDQFLSSVDGSNGARACQGVEVCREPLLPTPAPQVPSRSTCGTARSSTPTSVEKRAMLMQHGTELVTSFHAAPPNFFLSPLVAKFHRVF